MKFGSNIDMLLNQITNFVVHLLSSDPGTPTEGQVWYDTTNKQFKGRDDNSTEVFTRGVNVSTPITKSGNDDKPTIGIQAATSGQNGYLSSTDKAKLDAATDAATASTLMLRDSNGRAKVAAPAAASDIARLQDVQDAVAGVNWKDSVRVATTVNGTDATAFANGQVVDGVTLVTGDRLLRKNQTTASENGIFIVNASGAPTRATDADTGAEMLQAAVMVEEGTTNGDTAWVCSTNGPITLGSTSLTFVQFGGGSSYTAGNGLTLSGNTFNVGGNSGRIVVNADDVDLASGIATPGTYDNVTVDTYGRVTSGSANSRMRRFAANIGNGSSTSFTVNHALGNAEVIVQVYRNGSPFDVILTDVELTDSNNATVRFATAPTSNQFRVVVMG